MQVIEPVTRQELTLVEQSRQVQGLSTPQLADQAVPGAGFRAGWEPARQAEWQVFRQPDATNRAFLPYCFPVRVVFGCQQEPPQADLMPVAQLASAPPEQAESAWGGRLPE